MKRGGQYFNLVIYLLSSFSVVQAFEDASATLVFVGDIALDGAFLYQDKHGYCSYNQTFELVAPYLQQSDLTIGNLEAPFVTESMEKYEQKNFLPRLRSKPESSYSLKYAGFNILGLNNNHLTDFKERPIPYTINLLNKIGIKTFGYTYGSVKENRPQIPLIVDVRDIKIGFLGYCDVFRTYPKIPEKFHYTCILRRGNAKLGSAMYTDENAARDVKALKKRVDIVIVSMHWGIEYITNLSESQLQHFNHLKSLGVHLIIGSHPHVLQGHTATKSFLTAFSLGNFIFEPHSKIQGKFYYHRDPPAKVYKAFMKYVKANPNKDTLQSRILRVRINKKGFVSAQYLPLKIGFDPRLPDFKCFRPQPLQPARWIDVCNKNDKECFRFQTQHE